MRVPRRVPRGLPGLVPRRVPCRRLPGLGPRRLPGPDCDVGGVASRPHRVPRPSRVRRGLPGPVQEVPRARPRRAAAGARRRQNRGL
eukprot:4856332-Heterocapsa_arctica.AAC.1